MLKKAIVEAHNCRSNQAVNARGGLRIIEMNKIFSFQYVTGGSRFLLGKRQVRVDRVLASLAASGVYPRSIEVPYLRII